MITSLLGKALRTYVERFNMRSRECLPSDSTCVLEGEPGKLDISKDANVVSWFTLKTSKYDVIIDVRGDFMSLTTSFKKCNVIMT